MGTSGIPPSFMGRILGVAIVVAIQAISGVIHVLSGLFLVFVEIIGTFWLSPRISVSIFLLQTWGIYTFFYGLLTLVFAYGLWMNKRWGWIGTTALQIFVIVVDIFAASRLPLIPGVPEFAGVVEIPWSLAILVYVFQPHVRRTFLKPRP